MLPVVSNTRICTVCLVADDCKIAPIEHGDALLSESENRVGLIFSDTDAAAPVFMVAPNVPHYSFPSAGDGYTAGVVYWCQYVSCWLCL